MALKTIGSHEDAPDGIVAEINITPLTDIFLVLLIIFMVSSSVMSQLGVDVNLPQASSATSQAQPDGVIITLLPGGGARLNDLKIPAGQLELIEEKLRELFAKRPPGPKLVILEGDKQAFLGSAIEVMDHARKGGADKFAIATSLTQE